MKSLFIAASVVGAAAAGVILYLQRMEQQKKLSAGSVVDAASQAYHEMNRGIQQADRPAQHAMG